MDPRMKFFQGLVQNQYKRILELGPLNRPIADKQSYPNTFYCDIRSTEDVRRLYSGNDYLEATGITVDSSTIVPIDFVIQGSYRESFKEVEKFDYVIASHVLEHTEDLIFSLQDISTVLNPNGVFCIVYPDKRYCFDHFRTSASFRDAYNVFRNGPSANAPMVLDFYYSVIPENSPYIFWDKEKVLDHLPTATYANAVDRYEQVLKGVKMDDVHYWPFSDMDFLKFLYDCTRAGLLPFRCIAFQPCLQNDQQFMLALQLDPSALSNPQPALRALELWMENTLPDYYSTKDKMIIEENTRLHQYSEEQNRKIQEDRQNLEAIKNQLHRQEQEIQVKTEEKALLQEQISLQKECLKAKDLVITQLNSQKEDTNKKLKAQKSALDLLTSQTNEKMKDQEQTICRMESQTKEIHQQLKQKEDQVRDLLKEKNHLLEEIQIQSMQLNIFQSSTAWRITKPLRLLADIFKNLFHKNNF